MNPAPQSARPAWARNLRRTRGRRILWSTIAFLMFGGAAVVGALVTLSKTANLGSSERLLVAGAFGALLVALTFNGFRPIGSGRSRQRIGYIAGLAFFPLTAVTASLHNSMGPFALALLPAMFAAAASALAIMCGIGLARDIRDTTGVRG
jgi:hypothetical protein